MDPDISGVYTENKLTDPRICFSELPQNIRGWFNTEGKREYYEKLLGDNNYKTMIEIGSWLGQSTIWFAQRMDFVIAIDTWAGSVEHTNEILQQQGVSKHSLFDQFLSNTKGYKNIFPIRLSSRAAHRLRLPKVDFIYIDGDHSHAGTYADIVNFRKFLKDGGAMCGDDFQIPDVARALVDYCDRFDMGFTKPSTTNQWRIVDPKKEKISEENYDVLKKHIEAT